jgi:hypothetical protein
LTQAQYDRELKAGNIDENALYLTPDEKIKVPTKTSELENDSGFLTEECIPVVYTLPSVAKDGDMCLYAPMNTITLEDSGKRIYFDWEEFSKPVDGDYNISNIGYLTSGELVEITGNRCFNDCSISFSWNVNNNWCVYVFSFLDGQLNTEASYYNYIDENGESIYIYYNSVDELPLYLDVPNYGLMYPDQEIRTDDYFFFHTDYRLMVYNGGEWVRCEDKYDKEIVEASYLDMHSGSVFILPNKYYTFGEVTELWIELGEVYSSIENEYTFTFTSGETPTTLTLPESIQWANGNAPEFQSNAKYIITIVDNIASYITTANVGTGVTQAEMQEYVSSAISGKSDVSHTHDEFAT